MSLRGTCSLLEVQKSYSFLWPIPSVSNGFTEKEQAVRRVEDCSSAVSSQLTYYLGLVWFDGHGFVLFEGVLFFVLLLFMHTFVTHL